MVAIVGLALELQKLCDKVEVGIYIQFGIVGGVHMI